MLRIKTSVKFLGTSWALKFSHEGSNDFQPTHVTFIFGYGKKLI